jgi:hypothetical protein
MKMKNYSVIITIICKPSVLWNKFGGIYMNIWKIFCLTLLSLSVLLPLSAQDTPLFQISGDVTGMYTIGLEDNDQTLIVNNPPDPPGVYDDLNNGKNGYYTSININFLFTPVSYTEVYAKFLARFRPGSPYIPLQLENADADDFSVSIDSAYGRVNAIEGLGFDIPFALFLKAGKYDTTPANFQNVSSYGAESIMAKLRTKNTYALQITAEYYAPIFDSLGLNFTVSHKFNEGITPLYDTDGSKGVHGKPSLEEKYDIPMHLALRMKNLNTPLGAVSAELLYVYNAENIYSGSNFGADLGWEIVIPALDPLKIPIGLCFALYEKNIDPFASTALNTENKNYVSVLHENDHDTISFRRSLRIGGGLGTRYAVQDFNAEINLGYSYSQIAHIYRDTLNINSLSADLRLTFFDKYFIGGGVYVGTLGEVEWKTGDGTDITLENGYIRVFKPEENIGFEVFGGFIFGKSRLAVGYNCNKGISMNHSIESIPEAQIKYRQKDTLMADGLFETGGVFIKLVISW